MRESCHCLYAFWNESLRSLKSIWLFSMEIWWICLPGLYKQHRFWSTCSQTDRYTHCYEALALVTNSTKHNIRLSTFKLNQYFLFLPQIWYCFCLHSTILAVGLRIFLDLRLVTLCICFHKLLHYLNCSITSVDSVTVIFFFFISY